MSIEPTSVSKQPIREVESTSANFGSWTSMHGSSTGGKDRPLNNSLWEKAINGAQKLFGSAQSDPATLEEKGESEDRAESNQGQAYRNEAAIDLTSGFGGRRFGSFGGSAFGGNAFGSVVTSRATPEPRQSDRERSMPLESNQERANADYAAKQGPAERVDTRSESLAEKEKIEVEGKTDDDSDSKEKGGEGTVSKGMQRVMHDLPLITSSSVAQTSVVQADATTVQQQATTAANAAAVVSAPVQTPIAPEGTAPEGTAPAANPANASQAQTSSEILSTAIPSAANKLQASVQTPATNGAKQAVAAVRNESSSDSASAKAPLAAAIVSEKSPMPTTVEAPKTAEASNAATAGKDAVETVAAKTVPVSNVALLTKEPTSAAEATAPAAKDVGAGKDTLAFDMGKAKDALSDGLGKAAIKAAPAAAPNAPANPQTTAPTTTSVEARDSALKTLSSEAGNVNTRLSEAGSSETKEVSVADASKRDVTATAQQRASNARAASESASSQARTASQEGVALDAKSGQAAGVASASSNQFARESAVAATSRIQSPVTVGKGTAPTANGTSQGGATGVSGAQGMTNGIAAQGAQQGNSKQSDGDPASKQDFSAAMKQATSSKGSEKTADGAQSFEAKVEAAETRRTEAAGKARQTSYVSKTAAEVKEVVATLTKSIDRLVTDKGGAMNLKINFEGGGSLNLRVSMERGQVTTSMQTDVVGLEGAIKANWGELAHDWNQKGVRLNTPQFQNSESGKDSSFENLNEFASKQERQEEGRMSDGRGGANGQASRTRGFSSATPEVAAGSLPNTEQPKEVVSDREIKTYA